MGQTPDYLMDSQKGQPSDRTVDVDQAKGPDGIRHDVEQARARLAQNLNQLEHRVRTEFDWRVQFDRHPWAFVGGAFAAAFLLGLAVTPRRVTAPRAVR